jgi:alkylation response protein AidB-like acyl-CoA dehydrogenase
MGRSAMDQLVQLAILTGKATDPVTLDRIAQLQLDLADGTAMYERLAQELRQGHSFGFEVSTLKIMATETYARITELLVELAGERGGFAGEVAFGDGHSGVLRAFLSARTPMIYGGTVQIHRNMLTKGVLGLPG